MSEKLSEVKRRLWHAVIFFACLYAGLALWGIAEWWLS
jgi:choline-glycine betaine transporter